MSKIFSKKVSQKLSYIIFSVSFLTAVLLAAFLFLDEFKPESVNADSGWLSGWQYRKQVIIDNTQNTSTLINYQVLTTIDTASLITANKMQSDCDDIRFSDADGTTELSYWIESGCNTASTKAWVKVPEIPASSNKTIYMYYGNSSASSASNAQATFVFVEGIGPVDTSKYSTNIDPSRNLCSVAPTIGVDSGDYFNSPDSLYFYVKSTCSVSPWCGCGWHAYKTINFDAGNYMLEFYSKGWGGQYSYCSGGTYPDIYIYIDTTEIWPCPKYSVSGCNKASYGWSKFQQNFSVSAGNHNLDFYTIATDCAETKSWMDQLFIRKYSSPEPMISSIGSEEAPNYPNVTTQAADNIEKTSATLHGNVISDGGYTIIERGFYFGTSSNPSTKYVVSGAVGEFEKTLNNLDAGKKYYFKAFATNEKGTSYGPILNFITLSDTGWLSGWQYRKPVIIDNAQNVNVLADYQVAINTTQAIYNETGLIGSWHFNEGSGTAVTDMSGSSNNGIWNGTGSHWNSSGKYGSAGIFNGTNDYVSTTNQFTNPQTFSIVVWFKTSSASGHKIVGFEDVQTGTSSANYDRHLYVGTDGKLYFGIYDGACKLISTSETVNDGNWKFAVATFSSNIMKLYLNGEQIGSPLSVSGAQNYNGWWRIGSYKTTGWVNASDGYFTGLIDEVRIYNRELSTNEISALYNANKARLDYGDIRFTDDDGTTLLNYWQESDKNIWVKVPEIPASSNKTIYMYYGNSDATSAVSGANTFDFFDDFSTDTSGNYVVVGSGTKAYDANNKILKQTDTSQSQHWIVCTADTLPNSYVYQANVEIINDPPNRNHSGLATDFSTSVVTGYRLTHIDTSFPVSRWSAGSETGIGSFADGGIYADNKWLTERVYRNRTSGLLKYEATDGVTTVSGQWIDTTHTTGHLGFHSFGSEAWYDNIFVRKYTSPEPTTEMLEETIPTTSCVEHNVSGWAWSENIGWVSFSYKNCDTDNNGYIDSGSCGGNNISTVANDYGVDIDEATGVFSGYAWSPIIGWISFESSDVENCPSGVCVPTLDFNNNQISGYARVLSYKDDASWGGWLRLRDTNYGVYINSATKEFHNWAWAPAEIGWLSFNCENIQGATCNPDYKVTTTINIIPPFSVEFSSPPAISSENYCKCGTYQNYNNGIYSIANYGYFNESGNFYSPVIGNGILSLDWEYSSLNIKNLKQYKIRVQDNANPSEDINSLGVEDAGFDSADNLNFSPGASFSFIVGTKTNPTQTNEISYNKSYNWWIKIKNADNIWSDWIKGPSFNTPDNPFPVVRIARSQQQLIINQPVQFCATPEGDCATICGAGLNLDDPQDWHCSICYDSLTGKPCNQISGIEYRWYFYDRNNNSLIKGSGTECSSAYDYVFKTGNENSPNPKVEFCRRANDVKIGLNVSGSSCGSKTNENRLLLPLPQWKEVAPF